jgi:hypothetical protein
MGALKKKKKKKKKEDYIDLFIVFTSFFCNCGMCDNGTYTGKC